MECELEACPVPEIIWFQGSKVILDSSRIRMTKKATGKDTYLLRLEINDPIPEDGGSYRCNACNIFGESNANIALNFQGSGVLFLLKCPFIIAKYNYFQRTFTNTALNFYVYYFILLHYVCTNTR